MYRCIEHYTAAAKVNKEANFKGLQVYGLFTNMTRFTFYSYDPMSNTFCGENKIFIGALQDSFSEMIHSMSWFCEHFCLAHAADF